MEENAIFTFDSPKGQSSYIKVIGVGGGGGNAVNHMYRQGIQGVDFIVCNTDMKALNGSPVPNKIPLGDLGLGAGNKPERARKAAEDKADDIRDAISHNTQMLFITAGMGGGTGTGAAPVVAEIAKSIELASDENSKILVVAIVTRPFSFEGKRRREQADAGIEELRKHVDSIIVINNDKLRSFGNLDIAEAFGMADDVLLTAAKGIAEIITGNGSVNIDFQDVNTVMENSGTALMGAGSGKGENRAIDAITAATTSVLLDDSDIRGAKNVLLYFSYSPDHKITMDELGEITDYIGEKTNGTADVIWGAGIDESLEDELKVTLIATGFEKSSFVPEEPNVFTLPQDIKPEPAKPVAPVMPDEPVLITKSEPAVAAAPVMIAEPVVVAEPVKVAEPVMVAEPVKDSEPVQVEEPAVSAEKKNVFVLEVEDVEEPAPAPKPQQPVVAREDTMVSGIHMVNSIENDVAVLDSFAPASKPAAEPVAPKPTTDDMAERLANQPFSPKNDVRLTGDRADRIRFFHDLLRNDPNGAEKVQAMSTQEISNEELYEGRHSSTRESSSITMRPDGTIAKNAYFGDQPD